MAVTAQSVLKHVAVDMLSDAASKKWTIDQLVRYLNRVQQMIGAWRPDLFIEKRSHAQVAGTRQTLPSGYVRALDFLSNTDGSAVTMPPNCRAMLDAQNRNWRNDPDSDTIYHVMYDPREPLAYDVWPPATTDASLEVKLQKAITAITEPSVGQTYANVTGNLSLVDDSVWGAVAHGVAFLAYLLDSAYAKPDRAMAHAQAMAQLLDIEMSKALELGPKTDGTTPAPATSA
jgi:hypothetical protein